MRGEIGPSHPVTVGVRLEPRLPVLEILTAEHQPVQPDLLLVLFLHFLVFFLHV